MYKGLSEEDKDQRTLKINESPPDLKNYNSSNSHFVGNSTIQTTYNFGTSNNCDNFDSKLIDAELGLSEDHFSRPEGHFGFSNIEELEMAIETCKEMIMESLEKTDRRKKLVIKLVQLRLKLEDYKENPLETLTNDKVVLGHQFEIRKLERPQQYCEKCCQPILCPLYSWYCCKECGVKCHRKCLNSITRICAKQKVMENPTYLLNICPEVGISSQNYRCTECKQKLIIKEGFATPRKCDYNGMFYCSYCHWNSEIIIPARVIHNWDFRPRKVCRATLQFLRLMVQKPILNVESLNPMLFPFVKELCMVKKLREEILVMKQYFVTCRMAQEKKLLLILKDRQHFVEGPNMYSLQDLIDIEKGHLQHYLQNVYALFSYHITKDCQGCQGKGFICELCKEDDILFPFESRATACPKCSTLLHKECFFRRQGQCPKCIRRTKTVNK